MSGKLISQKNSKKIIRAEVYSAIKLDSMSVLEESITVYDTFGKIIHTKFKVEDNILFFDSTDHNLPQIVDIKFFSLPFHLSKNNTLIDTNTLSSKTKGQFSFYDYKVKKSNTENLFGTKGIDYDGSFSRGISFGNAQNLIYDAAFNLQMSGLIGDGISIKAAISDNQIPIQPEGNTQQIQEFDRIFIEIAKDKHSLLAGDFDVRPSLGYFMQYQKKLKGLSYGFLSNEDANINIKNRTSAAISKGRFNRQSLAVSEGNQGPYKLLGKQGERFIIVIAGSEKVFIDGHTIKRGQDEDYIMDYNLGEITFTTNKPVTNNSRIFVEFEYLDQQFSRSIITNETSIKWKNITTYINLFHEQDSKTPSINLGTSFDSTTIANLENLPESSGKLYTSGTRKVADNSTEQQIKYIMKDTFFLIDGMMHDTTILYYLEKPKDVDLYTAVFSDLGSNKADYSIKKSALNGRIYEWVAPNPQTGEPNGRYAPIVSITPPTIHQMIETGIEIKINKHINWRSELAISRKDLNRYSALHEDNDIGTALRSSLSFTRSISSTWNINSVLQYEFKNKNFTTIEPYRDSEFRRNWNISDLPLESEHQPQLSIQLSQNNGNSILYDFQGLYRTDHYNGNKHNWSTNLQHKGWQVTSDGSYLTNSNNIENSSYIKPALRIQKRLKSIFNTVLGVESILEKNTRKDALRDTFLNSSFYFYEISPYVKNQLNDQLKFTLKYTSREDQISSQNGFDFLSKSDNYGLATVWKPSKKTNISTSFNYRSFIVDKSQKSDLDDAKTLLGKGTINSLLFKGGLRWQTRYEVSSGQEPKSEFTFTEVRSGEGNYIFNDFNMDGTAQFNEYILAPYADTANYIKIRLFNNEFIRTDQVVLEQNIVIDPRHPLQKQKKEIPFWLNWSLRSTYKSTKKTTAASIKDAWNPLASGISDSNLIIDLTLLNALFIYRPADEIYDIQLKHSQRKSKQINTTGSEALRSSDYNARARWNIIKSLDVVVETARALQWSDSQHFDDRDYNIQGDMYLSKINYRWKRKLRFSLSYELNNKQNMGTEITNAKIQDFKLESTIKQSTKHSFNITTSFANVIYNASPGTALELIMLNGLKPGNNYIWSIRYDRKISTSVFMNFSYNGRKTGEADIFHTGNVQMRAIF